MLFLVSLQRSCKTRLLPYSLVPLAFSLFFLKEYLEAIHQLYEDWLIKKTSFNIPAPVLVSDQSFSGMRLEDSGQLNEEHCLYVLVSPVISTRVLVIYVKDSLFFIVGK